jgi:hypothetical protein
MFVNTEVENAIIGMTELNNVAQFINSHADDITDADTAVGLLRLIAGQLDERTKALRDAYYGALKDNNVR